MRLKWMAVAAIAMLGLTMSGCSNKPAVKLGKPVLEYLMGLEQNKAVIITDFKKTNGQVGDVFGQKTYIMAYEAVLEVVTEPKKIHVAATHGMFPGSGEPAHDALAPEEAAPWSKIYPISPLLVKKGMKFKATGSIGFFLTEKGWMAEPSMTDWKLTALQ